LKLIYSHKTGRYEGMGNGYSASASTGLFTDLSPGATFDERKSCLPGVSILGDFASPTAFAGPTSTDNQIRQQIIQQSVASYLATGHRCACPYNPWHGMALPAAHRAYIRPGGAPPICYASDVTEQMISDWKYQHETEGQPQR
jgi:hypothetical protein